MIEVSIVIPTYNRKKLLKINFFSSPCKLVCLHQNRKGPHIARNLGIKNTQGRIIIFVDSDIFTPPGFINEHMKFHYKFKDVVVSGPTVWTNKLNDVFSDIEKRKRKLSYAYAQGLREKMKKHKVRLLPWM